MPAKTEKNASRSYKFLTGYWVLGTVLETKIKSHES